MSHSCLIHDLHASQTGPRGRLWGRVSCVFLGLVCASAFEWSFFFQFDGYYTRRSTCTLICEWRAFPPVQSVFWLCWKCSQNFRQSVSSCDSLRLERFAVNSSIFLMHVECPSCLTVRFLIHPVSDSSLETRCLLPYRSDRFSLASLFLLCSRCRHRFVSSQLRTHSGENG